MAYLAAALAGEDGHEFDLALREFAAPSEAAG